MKLRRTIYCKLVILDVFYSYNPYDTIYTTIKDSEVQRIILQYCLDNDIDLISVITNYDDCKIKIKATKKQVKQLVLYLLTNYIKYFKNFKY